MVHPSVREQAAVEQNQSQVWAAVRGETAPVGQSSASGVAGRSSSVTVEGRAAAPVISAGSLGDVMAETAPTQSYQKIY